jgi:phosphonatase-like hydrolase
MTIRLLVSDMAGTTVRDDGLVEAAFTDAIAPEGIEPGGPAYEEALEVVRRTMGMSKIEVFRRILQSEPRAVAATRAFEDAVARRIEAGMVEPLPGVEEAFAGLRESGVKVALTTGFADVTREALVDHLGWRDLVDLSLSPSEDLRGRPHPDLALAALIRLRVDDVRELATVGDTRSDLEAGWRAGASVVAGVLTGAHDRSELEAAPHTHVVESMPELVPVLLEGQHAPER